MAKKDLLDLETRREIFDFIKRRPGMHLRGIEREVALPFGQVLYHLDSLEKNNLIAARKDGGFKRYFVKHLVGRQEKGFISAFRHDLPRRIAILLLLAPDRPHRDILGFFNVSGSTLSFHLHKMIESGVVHREEHGNENYYRLTDEKTAAKTLVFYRESFEDPIVDRFVEAWSLLTFKDPEARARALKEDKEMLARLKGDASPLSLALHVLHG